MDSKAIKSLDEIIGLVSNGLIHDAIKQFLYLLESKNLDDTSNKNSYYLKTILLSGRLQTLSQEIRLGLIKRDDEQVERNRISYEFLKMIQQFPKNVLLKNTLPSDTKTIERIEKIKKKNSFKYDLFFSFSSEDIPEATVLYETLVGFGFDVFISSEFFKNKVGASFQKEIEIALTNSKSFLLYWTDNSAKSKWVEVEYMAFFQEVYLKDMLKERNFYIIKPHNNCVDMPILLRSIQYAINSDLLVRSIIQKEESKGSVIGQKKQATHQEKTNYRSPEEKNISSSKEEKNNGDKFGFDKKSNNVFSKVNDLFKSKNGANEIQDKVKKNDLRINLMLNEDEMSKGVTKNIKYSRLLKCTLCEGGGFKGGGSKCNTCNGTGIVRILRNTFLGNLATTQTCPNCDGTGKNKCNKCKGTGFEAKDKIVKIVIPPNVKKGNQLRLRGQGNICNGQIGDLYIMINTA